jgi:cytosine/uracil/thiamine/allantoin permease
MFTVFIVFWKNNLAAGLFAPQDIQAFRLFLTKPYTKIHAVGFGIWMAYLYREINDYKKLAE